MCMVCTGTSTVLYLCSPRSIISKLNDSISYPFIYIYWWLWGQSNHWKDSSGFALERFSSGTTAIG